MLSVNANAKDAFVACDLNLSVSFWLVVSQFRRPPLYEYCVLLNASAYLTRTFL
jgi:hypothetical protein